MALTNDQIRKQTSKWFHENSRPNWFHQQVISILKCGAVPKHIAIIMDGNRRYAKKEHVDRQVGHMKGFDKLSETLEWCLDLGINEVTVYAFSIENFKRSAEEVSGLLDLLRVKMKDLIDERDKLEEHGVCVRVLGNISLMPEDIQHLIAKAVSMSSGFNRAFLNVCIAYTSREEITSAIKLVTGGLVDGKLEEKSGIQFTCSIPICKDLSTLYALMEYPDVSIYVKSKQELPETLAPFMLDILNDVDSNLLQSCLYTAPCQPVDLVVRTSGEVRLSDFLLWQSSYSLLSFVRVLWPDFSRWDLYGAVLFYQQHEGKLKEIQKSHQVAADIQVTAISGTDRKISFLDEVNKMKQQKLQSLLT